MVQKRSKDQLIAQILITCQGEGAIKTKIVYQSGLNFKTIRPYLSLLTEKGHITQEGDDMPIYRITEKGVQALEALKMIEMIYS